MKVEFNDKTKSELSSSSKIYNAMIKMPEEQEIRLFQKHFIYRNGNPVVKSKLCGRKIFCRFDHLLPYYEMRHCRMNKPLCYVARYIQNMNPGVELNIIDVGANIGDTVICIGNTNAFYICIEGTQEFCELLKMNLSAFHYALEECFVSDIKEQLSANNLGNGTALAVKSNESPTMTRTIDEIIDEKYSDKIIHLMKIDTDGFDFKVLRSGKKMIQSQRPVLYFEWDYAHLIRQGEDVYSIFPFLRENGYEKVLLFDQTGEVVFPVDTSDISTLKTCIEYTQRADYDPQWRSVNYFDVLCFNKDDKYSYEDLLLEWYPEEYNGKSEELSRLNISTVEYETIGITAALYYASNEGVFSEGNMRTVFTWELADGFEFSFEPEIEKIRFDPLEGQYCIVTDLEIASGRKKLSPEWTNGIRHEDTYYFFTTDPQLEIMIPQGTTQLWIRAKIIPMTTNMLSNFVEYVQKQEEISKSALQECEEYQEQLVQKLAQDKELQAQLEQKLAHDKEHQTQLEQELAQYKTYWEQLKQKLAQDKKFQEQLKQELTQYKACQEQLEQEVTQYKACQEQLEQEVTRYKACQEQLEQKLDQKKKHQDLLKQQLELDKKQRKQLERQVVKGNESREQLEQQLVCAKEQNNKLEKQFCDLNIHYQNMQQSVSFRIGRVITWLPRKIKGFISRKFYLHNYFADLNNRINSCESRFPESPRKTAVRMIWWNFKSLFKHHVQDPDVETSAQDVKQYPELSEERLNIGFLFGGGFGDRLIAANYLYCFREKYDCPEMWIDVFFSGGRSLSEAIFEPGLNCDRLLPETENIAGRYDLFVWVNRYPRIYVAKRDRIESFQPELLEYVEICTDFYHHNRRLIDESPYRDGNSAEMSLREGRTRIQQADIEGLLGIGKSFTMPVFIRQDEDEYLSSVGLNGKSFITLHRGSDAQYSKNVVKLWPLEYYNALIKMLKREYPGYMLVQIGINDERCPAMSGIDLSLVGKTTMEDVKVLLRNGKLHIDGEGGFGHLREALHAGPSVLLFGPTNIDFFGYKDNINIRGDGCDMNCEWRTRNWLDRCMKGFEKPPCMLSIKPEYVMDKIRDVL